MKRLVIDVESCSILDLKKTGAHVYWDHPSTQIICLAYAIDNGPITVWRPNQSLPQDLYDLFLTPDYMVVAHNYLFEYCAWRRLRLDSDPAKGDDRFPAPPILSRWSCTMARALCYGFPAGLEELGAALKLKTPKMAQARSLMLRMGRPRSFMPDGTPVWWHETDPDKLTELIAYCVGDVAAEREADGRLLELPDRERAIFDIDGAINLRGLHVDLNFIDRMARIGNQAVSAVNRRLATLTQGKVTTVNQTDRLHDWLNAECGRSVTDFTQETVTTALRDRHLHPIMRTVLELRQDAARASARKLVSIKHGLSKDNRLRGLFQYGGAGRTMRWAGRRVQPQNFPRGTLKKSVPHATAAILGDANPDDLELLFGKSALEVVASCLRGIFVASRDCHLVVGDLAQIEARIIAWLAGQQDILDVFAKGEDVYTYTAWRLGSQDRQFGKVLVLACSFGMGPARFQATAATYGISLTLGQADNAVHGWRDTNEHIVRFWWDLGDAMATMIHSKPGWEIKVGCLTLLRGQRGVAIELPSGRRMFYHDLKRGPDGDITFMGVDPKTKHWSVQRTYGGKLAENCIAEGTLTLTARGWVLIERVRPGDFLWTGHSWAAHSGLVCKGEQDVVCLDGVWMTPDHRVLTEQGWTHAEACDGLDRQACRLPTGAGARWQHQEGPPLLARVLRVRARAPGAGVGFGEEQDQVVRLPAGCVHPGSANNARHDEALSVLGVAQHDRPLPPLDACGVAQLRRPGDHGLPGMGSEFRDVLAGYGADLPAGTVAGSRGQRGELPSEELPVGDPPGTSAQHPAQSAHTNSLGDHDGGRSERAQWDRRGDPVLPGQSRRARVFDVLDVGHQHRFVIAGATGPLIVHNCTQAIARDVMCEALIEYARHRDGGTLVGTIHDEIISEEFTEQAPHALAVLLEIMRRPVAWAPGLPVDAEGWHGPRYQKS